MTGGVGGNGIPAGGSAGGPNWVESLLANRTVNAPYRLSTNPLGAIADVESYMRNTLGFPSVKFEQGDVTLAILGVNNQWYLGLSQNG